MATYLDAIKLISKMTPDDIRRVEKTGQLLPPVAPGLRRPHRIAERTIQVIQYQCSECTAWQDEIHFYKTYRAQGICDRSSRCKFCGRKRAKAKYMSKKLAGVANA